MAGAVQPQESAETQLQESAETSLRESAEMQPQESAGTAEADEAERPEGQKDTVKRDTKSGTGQPSAVREDTAKRDTESGDGEPESEGYVYVCGAVENPGVYPVREGMRVFEALELAGGFAQDADLEWLNQAEHVQDGQRLYVYTREETQKLREAAQETGQVLWPWESGTTSDAAAVPGNIGTTPDGAAVSGNTGTIPEPDSGKVNLNTANREELKTLPGIGDAKADAIVRYREEHGPFGAIEEIQNISGIKNAVFSKIRDLITV